MASFKVAFVQPSKSGNTPWSACRIPSVLRGSALALRPYSCSRMFCSPSETSSVTVRAVQQSSCAKQALVGFSAMPATMLLTRRSSIGTSSPQPSRSLLLCSVHCCCSCDSSARASTTPGSRSAIRPCRVV